MKKLFLFFISAVSFILITCNENPPVVPPPIDTVKSTIELSVEWTDLYRIKLKWNKAEEDTLNNFRYDLVRKDEAGNEVTRTFYITGIDTGYIDDDDGDSLKTNQKYSYKVKAYNDSLKLKDTSSTVTTQTLSPISHNITWEIDTLGQSGDFLHDVWGLDKNNVWAVGAITLNGTGTNIIKWNGSYWDAFPRAIFSGWGNAIFGFSETDFWVVGGGH